MAKINILPPNPASFYERGVRAIARIERTAGDGSPGTVDTYTIYFTDSTTTQFQVVNGRDGVDGIDGLNGSNAGVFVSEAPPPLPADGWQWFDKVSGVQYTRVQGQWVEPY